MSVSIDLDGKTAIVTGAGRGIGEVIADQLAESGTNVVVAARTESEIANTDVTGTNLRIDGGVGFTAGLYK